MAARDATEAREADVLLRAVLDAPGADDALRRLRTFFVERLDFEPAAGAIPLRGDGLPSAAARIAEREGVRVVAAALPGQGRVLASATKALLAEVRRTLAGDLLLVVTNAPRSEWHFVYPSTAGGRDVLRRMVIHKGQPFRTVATQLEGIYDAARRSDVRAALERAYDVEAVTKSFFREYRTVFEKVQAMVAADLPDPEQRKLYCQALFNRLMFLYFLQRKGWLTFDGDADYLHALWADWERERAAAGDGGDGRARGSAPTFYNTRLENLFFVALNNERTADWNHTRQAIEPLVGRTPFLNGGLFEKGELDGLGVRVPDDAIRAILYDLFDKFNFTIAESTPYDQEVAVDPEMLGKVFEELVTDRHGTGSYYTPRPIVAFMCREALKGHLLARVPGLPAEAASAFVDEHQVSRLTVRQAPEVLAALQGIAVVDPACGSGAYLLGMLHELIELQRLLYSSELIAGSKELYDLKLQVIERNVYGVDKDRFAVNIAMLRLWLSLVVDWNGPGDPPALPNLAFKIVCGDALLAPNPQAETDLFRLTAHAQAVELAELKAEYMRETGEEKRDLVRRIGEAQASLSAMLAHSPAPQGSVDWRVAFAEVFDRGGFDAVLANPPYVRQEQIRDIKPGLRAAYGALYSGTADLYVYFYYRALQLLRPDGMLVFISSNKWFRAAYGAKRRAYIAETTGVSSITDFGDLAVFEAAAAYPMIFIAQKGAGRTETRFTQVRSLDDPYPDVRAVIVRDGQLLPLDALDGATWSLTDAASAGRLRTMARSGVPLGEYVGGQIYYGIKTGFNTAFVIDGAKRAELIAADPKSAEIIKPLLSGRDIKRWVPDYKDRWMIVTKIGVGMERYPVILQHLSHWEAALRKREDQGNHWWELRACAYYHAFERPKITLPDIAVRSRFAYDTQGTYLGNTGYIIPSDDLYLLGILNSYAVEQFYASISSQVRGGYLRFIYQYLEQIPIPNATPAERNAIADLARQCLDARGQGPEVAAWEAEIDARVARLYGLAEA